MHYTCFIRTSRNPQKYHESGTTYPDNVGRPSGARRYDDCCFMGAVFQLFPLRGKLVQITNWSIKPDEF